LSRNLKNSSLVKVLHATPPWRDTEKLPWARTTLGTYHPEPCGVHGSTQILQLRLICWM